MATRYDINVDNLDNELLDKQRGALLNSIDECNDPDRKELLMGIEALLTHMSDLIYHGDCRINETNETINEKEEKC